MADDIIEVKIPEMGESITEATIASWFKKEGDAVEADEPLAELETDKVTVEVPAPSAGTIVKILKSSGDTVKVKEVVAQIKAGAGKAAAEKPGPSTEQGPAGSADDSAEMEAAPAARKLAADNEVDLSKVSGSGKRGQVLKEDVQKHLESNKSVPAKETSAPAPTKPIFEGPEEEKAVPMSKLRQAIANRLVQVQQTAAILTTFNEVDMHNVMQLRSKYKDQFLKKYDVKLGFMSFFTRAVVEALHEFPAINAEIRGNEIVYKNFYHVGMAVGGPKGLVVPVVRHADKLSLADIEKEIGRLAEKVHKGSIGLQDLEGGTFTITNGGVYGSMMSTPIINPPQSGILGMHNIVKRPVVVDDEIVIRPMMYLALSYDHRIVDGKEAVQFLVKIKEAIEDPARLLLGV